MDTTCIIKGTIFKMSNVGDNITKKVNLGCGTTCLKDWINIESSYNARLAKFPRIRYLLYKIGALSKQNYDDPWENFINYITIHDLKKPLPFNNNYVDVIYTSHLLEHLSRDEAENLLKECWRVMKVGGIIRIVVLDLRILVKRYVEDIPMYDLNDVYIPSDILLEQMGIVKRRRLTAINAIIHQYEAHRWMYDEDSLRHLLKNVGFKNIEKKNYREGKTPDIEYLDNRSEESLYMESNK